jgi:peptide/nickel transport system permease protein
MLRYLLRRFLSGLTLLLVFASILFFVIQIILPGDFASQFALSLTSDQVQELRQQLGIDLPLWKSYFIWLSNILRGNLGNSFTGFGVGAPVITILKNTLPVTLLIFGLGTILAFFFGQWLGRLAAWRGPGLFSGLVSIFSVAFYTSFPPWFAFLVIYIISLKFNVVLNLQSRSRLEGFRLEEMQVLSRMLIGLAIAGLVTIIVYFHMKRLSQRRVPNFLYFLLFFLLWIGSWFTLGIQSAVPKVLSLIALPTIIFSLLSFGEIMLITRISMTETLHEDYIQTARAKGLSDHLVRDRHAARNALLPVLSRMVINIPILLTSMVMLEEVLNIQGIGTALFYAVGMQDINMALGMIIVIGFISLISRLSLDVIQVILDPRIRTGS